jgi:apolipoprotein N-acyltransferase
LSGGSLYALAFPTKIGLFFFPGQIIGLALLFYSLKKPDKNNPLRKNLKLNLLLLLAFSFGYYQTGYYWLPETLRQFGNLPVPINYVLGVLFTLIIMPQFTIFLLINTFINKKFPKIKSSIIFTAFFLTLLEYFTPQQFPAHAGHPWMHIAPHLGLAPIFGYPIYSFISFLLALAIVKLFQQKKIDWPAITISTILIALNFLLPQPSSRNNPKINRIRLVQANIGNFMKLSSENGDSLTLGIIYDRYYNLSTKDKLNSPPDLIIWPETAFPEFINSKLASKSRNFMPELLRRVVDKTKAELFTGGYEEITSKEFSNFKSQYNTAFFISNQAVLKEYYHKMKLIPFGEGLPFGPLNKYLSKIITNISYFAKGSKYSLFKTKNGTPFFSLICYEVLFPSLVKNFINRLPENPHFMINLTNDSWYGNTSEPHQHLFLAKWRAVEFNIPIIRMTNTGISSIIYPDGSESKRIPYGKIDSLDLTLKTYDRTPTFFQKFGIYSFLLLGIILYLLELLLFYKIRRKK